MSILKGSKKAYIGSAAAYIVVGVLMCIWPVRVSQVLCYMGGAALTAGGIWKAVRYFRAKEYGLTGRADFAVGVLSAMLGALLMAKPTVMAELVPVLLGAMVLVNSVFQIQVSLELKRVNYAGWWRQTVISLVCAAVALFMMFNPFGSYELLSVIMGAAFIADGVSDLWFALYVTRKLKKMNLL